MASVVAAAQTSSLWAPLQERSPSSSTLLSAWLTLSDPSLLEQHLAVNLFGPYRMIQAFLPKLIHSGGAIVNNLSVNALMGGTANFERELLEGMNTSLARIKAAAERG